MLDFPHKMSQGAVTYCCSNTLVYKLSDSSTHSLCLEIQTIDGAYFTGSLLWKENGVLMEKSMCNENDPAINHQCLL